MGQGIGRREVRSERYRATTSPWQNQKTPPRFIRSYAQTVSVGLLKPSGMMAGPSGLKASSIGRAPRVLSGSVRASGPIARFDTCDKVDGAMAHPSRVKGGK